MTTDITEALSCYMTLAAICLSPLPQEQTIKAIHDGDIDFIVNDDALLQQISSTAMAFILSDNPDETTLPELEEVLEEVDLREMIYFAGDKEVEEIEGDEDAPEFESVQDEIVFLSKATSELKVCLVLVLAQVYGIEDDDTMRQIVSSCSYVDYILTDIGYSVVADMLYAKLEQLGYDEEILDYYVNYDNIKLMLESHDLENWGQ